MQANSERRLIHKGVKFDFEQVTFTGADGRTVRREVVRHPGAVVILPLLGLPGPGREVVMIRNQRFTLERELWELPAGTMEPPEPPPETARRELEEETGYYAGLIQPLGTFLTTPGMTDELMHAFVASDLSKVPQRLEEDERIRVEVVSVDKAFALLDSGELQDAKSMLTLMLARRKGLI